MHVDIHDRTALGAISASSLLAYVQAADWEKADSMGKHAVVYTKQRDGRQWDIVVPLKDTFADFAVNMAESIQVLSVVEQRSQLDVYQDLLAVGADVIRLTALDGHTAPSFSLRHSGEFLSEAYALLAAAARAAERPLGAYRGAASKEVSHFLDHVVPAPTDFRGFDLTLYSPIMHYGQAEMFSAAAAPPFSRRAVRALASGLSAADDAISESRAADSLEPFERAVSVGVSANLCAAIAGLTEQSHDFGAGCAVDVRWAAAHPQSGAANARIGFSIHSVGILNDARRHLLARASFPDEHIVGDPVVLARQHDQQAGRALVLPDRSDLPPRLEVQLDESDYDLVIRAFQSQVKIELDGDLHPAGRGYELRNPHNVRLLEDPAE